MKWTLVHCRWTCLILLWCGFLLPAGWRVSLAAETTDSAPTLSVPATENRTTQTPARELAYRRIFVPADDPERWPVGSERYLPMDRMKFDQRLRQAEADRRIPASLRLHAQTLILHAKLKKMGRSSLNSATHEEAAPWQLTGSASLNVSLADMQPDLLSLEPLNLAVSSTHWTYSGDRGAFPRGKGVFPSSEARPMKPGEQSAESVPARWGLWKMGFNAESASPSKPRMGVSVDRSGTLKFQWQLVETRQNGSHASDQSVNFVLRTPRVVRKTMDLVLPAGAAVEVKPGIVTGDDPQGPDFRVWHLELGVATEHRLNIRPRTGDHETLWLTGPRARQAIMPRVRQSTEYRLSPAGLELVTTLRLENPISSARSLQLRLARSTLVTQVAVDRRAVGWEIEEAEDSSGLQVPMESGNQMVQVQALLPILLDEPWQLPTIRPLDVDWVQGSTSLRIHPRLQLQSLVPIDCTIQQVRQAPHGSERPLATDRPPARETMERATRYDLLESTQQATLRIVVGKQPIRLQLRAATTTSQRDNTVMGHTVAVIHNVGQPQYFVEAEIAPHWKLLSAETDPVDALARWDLFGDGDRQVVRIGFATALLPGASVRIELDGRAITDFATEKKEVATVESLRMVKFRNVTARRQLLLLQSHPAGQLTGCQEAQDAQIATDSVTSDDQQLLPEGWQGVLLDLDRLASSAVIDPRPQPATYTGEVHVELSALTAAGLEHDYWIECVPIAGAVTDIALRFSGSVPRSMSWDLKTDARSEISRVAAKPVQPQIVPGTLNDENQVRLVLPLALSKPFRLEACYSTPHQASELAKTRIVPNVISLPEALTSQTWVLFRSGREGLAASAGESTAVAFPATVPQVARVVPSAGDLRATGRATGDSPATRFSTNSTTGSLPVLGCYRLDSARLSHGGEGANQERGLPALVPAVSASRQASSGWSRRTLFARFADFSTLCSADGTALNVMVYHLENHRENHGARQAEITLPAGTVLQSVWQDGRKLNAATAAASDSPWVVSLGPPASHRQATPATLTLRYVSHGQPLGWLARMEPAWPRVSFPVMQGRWTVWTAQPWTVRITSGDSTHGLAGWRSRLFGPLARWSRKAFFNPLQSRSWQRLWAEPWPRSWALPRWNRLPVERPSADIISPVSLHFPETQVAAGTTEPTRAILEMPGWRAHPMEFVGRPVAVELVRIETVQAKWLLLVLLVTVIGAWQLARWPRFLVLALALAAATCWLVEPDWIPAGSAREHAMEIPAGSREGGNFLGNAYQVIFLGLLGSLILRGVWHRPARIRRGDSRIIVPMALVLWLGSHGRAVRCDDDPGKQTSVRRTAIGSLEPRALPRLLIPVNPQGEFSQEGEVYVPQSLYRQLFEPPRQTLATAQWVLTAAHYRGCLLEQKPSNRGSREPEANGRQYVCGKWKLSFDITTTRPHGQWVLPLKQGSAQWFEDQHRLDGEPLHLQWLPGEAGCRILLPQPGAHRLELALRPGVLRQPRSASLRVDVPAVAGATLDLKVPAELAGLKILHATNIEQSSSTESIQARLQPVEAIEVRWTPAHRTVDARARWNAEQLLWLKVEPSRTLLEMKLRISASAGPLPTIQLDTEPQWELLPLGPESPIDDLETLAGNPRTLQLKLRPEIRTPVEIPLRFQFDRDTSIGRIAYPRLRLVNVATSRQVLAVSVAAGLSYQEQADSRWKVLSPEEFMARWGDGQTEPLFAYVLSNQQTAHLGTPLGALEVRPDPQSFTAKQSLTLRCGLEKTALRYQAQIDSIAGPLFIHRLEVPANLRLEAVHLRESTREGTIRQVRWATATNTRTGSREVTVFFSRPIRGPHELILSGHFVQQPNVPTGVPRVVLKQADASPTQVEIFRAANIAVTGSWPPSPQTGKPPSAVNPQDVRVDCFLLAQHDPKVVQYTVTPNESRGLRQTDPPRAFQQATRLEDMAQTFRGGQEGYLAKQPIDSQAADRVTMPLAQMHGTLSLQGEWAGMARLVLHPGKADQCRLQLPPQSRLLQLFVGGQPVPREEVGDSGWCIGLGPPSMPRIIAVSYTTKLDLQGGVARLRAPQLLLGAHALRPSSSLWEVRIAGSIEPTGSAMGQAVAGREIDALTFARRGFEACLQSLEEAGPLAFQLPHWEAKQWFHPWQSHLEYAFARWKQVGLSDPPLSLKGSPGWQALCDALGHPEQGVEKGADANHAMSLAPWEEPAGEDVSKVRQRPRHYAGRTDGVLKLRLGPGGGYLTGRRLSAVLLVSFALLALFMETRIRDRVRRWAFYQKMAQVATRIDGPRGMLPTLLAAGLVWWLWLTPSVVGFAVVLVTSLALAKRWWLTRNATRNVPAEA